LLYWAAAAFATKATRRRESIESRLSHGLPLALAIALLVPRHIAFAGLSTRFLPQASWTFWLGAVLLVLGLAFSVLARVYLGRNWSGTVTLKSDHTLIRGGPYLWVRHPIYTGILLAIVGSVIAQGEYRGPLALALVILAFTQKIRTEERFMLEQFGEAYARFQREVPALIPGLLLARREPPR
jgi:protein-S-isoprenylcysteine O-methyltransferase Ste14